MPTRTTSRTNEVLAARGALDRWVTADDVRDVDAHDVALAMAREAANLRDFCGDVLRGDGSIRPAVAAWHKSISSER